MEGYIQRERPRALSLAPSTAKKEERRRRLSPSLHPSLTPSIHLSIHLSLSPSFPSFLTPLLFFCFNLNQNTGNIVFYQLSSQQCHPSTRERTFQTQENHDFNHLKKMFTQHSRHISGSNSPFFFYQFSEHVWLKFYVLNYLKHILLKTLYMVNKIPHIIINKINILSYGKYQKRYKTNFYNKRKHLDS